MLREDATSTKRVAERWVRSCRRDRLDHIGALNLHLKRLLSEYVHEDRTHLGLEKERPDSRIR
jgi:hypothetical protein